MATFTFRRSMLEYIECLIDYTIYKIWKRFHRTKIRRIILAYKHKKLNAKNRRAVQQTSYPTEINARLEWKLQHRNAKEHNPQSITHTVPKPDDSRATDNNGRDEWESIKRRCKGLATRNINK